NSARFYADALFSKLEFDACTVSAYMGRDSVEPFLEYEGHGVFVLVRTSNPGAADFQELHVGGERLYEIVARTARTWDDDLPGTIGFVVGGTDPAALRAVRSMCPEEPLLIPGIGTQGGDAEAVMGAASDGPLLVNSGRQIIYASNGQDFAAAAAKETVRLRDLLEQFRG
ncbi:MAG: orotidine-5'-phosphate decarboxylase, partial [Rhodothermales bacterium]